VKEEALAHGGFVAPKRKKETNKQPSRTQVEVNNKMSNEGFNSNLL